jgi:aldose 1-epimerase
MSFALGGEGLSLACTLTNAGAAPTPLGIGWHPYFPRPRGTRLRARAGIVFGRDARTLPIGPRASAGLDGGDAVLDGLDTHFAGWDGGVEIAWPDGATLRMIAAGAWASNLQVFAPRVAAVIAVEPVSHAPDSANRAAAAAHGAMHLVAPGATLDGSLMIHWC